MSELSRVDPEADGPPGCVGSEADAPTMVKAPGNADAPVVLNTSRLIGAPLDANSATDCCWFENGPVLL
jgi:hypothetical protein